MDISTNTTATTAAATISMLKGFFKRAYLLKIKKTKYVEIHY
jgi:hypothetical protein